MSQCVHNVVCVCCPDKAINWQRNILDKHRRIVTEQEDGTSKFGKVSFQLCDFVIVLSSVGHVVCFCYPSIRVLVYIKSR